MIATIGGIAIGNGGKIVLIFQPLPSRFGG
jgi:hypothetical protein